MIRRKRSAITVLMSVALVLAISACQATAAQSQQQLQTATVTRGNITATVSSAGNVSAKAQVTTAFQTSGQIQSVNVKVGDQVKAGQVMASLQTTNLQAALASAQAAVQTAQANLAKTQQGPLASQIKSAQAGVASAQAALRAAQAKADAQPDQIVIDQNNLANASQSLSDAQNSYNNLLEYPNNWRRWPAAAWSQQKSALDNATINYNSALATYQLDLANINDTAVRSAAAQLASAQAQLKDLEDTPTPQDLALSQQSVDQAQIQYQQAESDLRKSQLIAPFDAVVADVNMQVGQQASASTSTTSTNATNLVLVDLSQLLVQVNVAESDVPRVKVGQTAQVTLDALPGETYPGHVIEVSLAGVTTQGVVNYPVTVVLDQPGTNLPIRPGMTANVNIVVEESDNVLLVPNRAIKTSGRNRTITVLQGGKQVPVNVTLGLSNDTESEVTSGLKEGDVVVIPQTTTTTGRGGPGGGGIAIPGGFGR